MQPKFEKPKHLKAYVPFLIQPEQHQILKAEAQKRNVPVSRLLRQAVTAYIEERL
jgi:hypothetical protein